MQLVGVPDPSQPPATAPLAVVRTFRAYYSPLELHHLVHLQAQHPAQAQGQGQHKQLSDHRIELYRQLAAGPRRTIATAQKLYHRFHLHFSLVEFPYHDVSLAALLVASKLEDTLKKLRDIQIAAYQVSNLLEGGSGLGEGDSAAQEAHRPHLIGIERLILQTICFNLNLHRPLGPAPPDDNDARDADNAAAARASLILLDHNDDETSAAASALTTGDGFRTLFRLAASIPSLPLPLRPNPTLAPPPPLATTDFFALPQSQQAPAPSSSSSTTVTNAAASGGGGGDAESDLKSLTRLAYLLLTDLHRTIAPLSYPPHTCAAACIYLAGYLLCSAAAAAAASQQQISDERAQEEEGRDGGAGAGSGAVWDEEMEQNWAGMCESEPDDISDISQTLLDLLISLCPPPPLLAASSSSASHNPSTSSPHLLISPHSSLASPSESSSSLTGPNSATNHNNNGKPTTTTTTTTITSEREKHLLAAGCPNAFTHPALRSPKHSTTVDDLMKVKIRVRAAAAAAAATSKKQQQKRKDLATRDEGEEKEEEGDVGVGDQTQVGLLKRARRWYALDRGLDDVGRIRDEKDLKERIRAEERSERHQQQQQQQLAAGGGGEAGMGMGPTDQERERERRERRERLKPGSVRYRF
ncbi:hypothetical protein C6P46_005150 [Rhodotorula mucilaginosa]|uniref:Cyclin N-terminal domain-containing protein n=1 Tax=Rhodotorula mucilaginosa TaxID=5537 RepID=A0A9P6W177_RHOMI|nr:hypothetical protein C6P46_005150 [Rhodotorula mucilaginosa]